MTTVEQEQPRLQKVVALSRSASAMLMSSMTTSSHLRQAAGENLDSVFWLKMIPLFMDSRRRADVFPGTHELVGHVTALGCTGSADASKFREIGNLSRAYLHRIKPPRRV